MVGLTTRGGMGDGCRGHQTGSQASQLRCLKNTSHRSTFGCDADPAIVGLVASGEGSTASS
jgi:hypothetical protein